MESTVLHQKKVKVLGVWVDNISKSEIVERITDIIESHNEQPNLIGSANIHKLNVAYYDQLVAEYLNKCKLCYCDGNGVRWGSALLGHPLKERMTAPDFILDVFRQCVRKGYKVYVLGGKPGVLEDAFKYILKHVPDLNVAGLHHGHFDLVKENERIIKNINEVKPDLLIVGMGIPRQEKWALMNINKLEAGTVWALGATFDYFAGVQSRGPVFLQARGHEWLGRLMSDPYHLAKRYLLGNPLFFYRIMKEKFFSIKS